MNANWDLFDCRDLFDTNLIRSLVADCEVEPETVSGIRNVRSNHQVVFVVVDLLDQSEIGRLEVCIEDQIAQLALVGAILVQLILVQIQLHQSRVDISQPLTWFTVAAAWRHNYGDAGIDASSINNLHARFGCE